MKVVTGGKARIRNRRIAGQATIEYLLVLSTAVLIASIVITKLIRPAGDRLSDVMSRRISDMFSKNVYQFRIGR